jgi:DNA helicase-2/ATP-dependent DNA helicase PcrA
MEEERRLAFVAMTRAEKGLYLSEAEGRNLDGSMRYPSRFLLEIDPGLLSFTQPPDEGLLREARSFIEAGNARLPESAPAPFAAGDRVVHGIMGAGTVEEVLEDRSAWLIRFDGLDTARAISFRARLEPECVQ